jgi:hydrogenase small subunit
MTLSRRDFLKASAALAGAIGIAGAGLARVRKALAEEAAAGAVPVVWLQAQTCSGCSVSFLNSINLLAVGDLLKKTVALRYHPTLMAAGAKRAVSEAESARAAKGYVLVVEGAVPTAQDGEHCHLWPGTTALAGVKAFARDAAHVLAVGTCACYGGVPAAKGGATQARCLKGLDLGRPVINIPGCPAHPDWVVGTVAHLLKEGKAPALDAAGRPAEYYGKLVHDACPNKDEYDKKYARKMKRGKDKGLTCLACHTRDDRHVKPPRSLGEAGCLCTVGCRGRTTGADCPVRKWNGEAPATPGVNWCVGAGGPCQGCTEPGFPDAMSPFFTLSGPGAHD